MLFFRSMPILPLTVEYRLVYWCKDITDTVTKSYVGPYIEQDGDSKFEYLVLRNPREPSKILAIMTKEISTKAIRVAMQTNALCDKCGNTCGARS